MRLLIVVVGLPLWAAGLLASCSNEPASKNVIETHSQINSYESRAEAWESADVSHDVAAAIGKGDRRFLCVTGEGVYAPGLSESEFSPGVAESEVDKSRFRIIDNTYDDIDPDDAESIARFKRSAVVYAKYYNLLLKKKLADE